MTPGEPRTLADLNFQKAHYLAGELKKRGFAPSFDHPYFNEFTVKCPVAPERIVELLSRERVLAGLPLGQYYPEMKDHLLVCVTEKRSPADIDRLAEVLAEVASR